MADAQLGFYCKRSVPIAAGYSVSNAFRTQASRPRRSSQLYVREEAVNFSANRVAFLAVMP